jgi:hypothetical protein
MFGGQQVIVIPSNAPSTMQNKHSWGKCVVSLETAWRDIAGYSKENP